MTKHRLILGMFAMFALTTQGAMAMDTFQKLFWPSESKESGFTDIVPGLSSKRHGHAEQKQDEKFVRCTEDKKQESETDELSIEINPLHRVGRTWNFKTIHHEMKFQIGELSAQVQSFKTSGVFMVYKDEDSDTRFILLPTMNGQVLIRHDSSSSYSAKDITQQDIDTFKNHATACLFSKLSVPLADCETLQGYEKIQITQHGIGISKTMRSDSKLDDCVKGMMLHVNTPFSFALIRNVNDSWKLVVSGKVTDFSVLELYRGG